VLGQDAAAQGGAHVPVRLDEEARRTHRRVIDAFAEGGIHQLDHEFDNRTGRVEFAAHATLAPEFGEH